MIQKCTALFMALDQKIFGCQVLLYKNCLNSQPENDPGDMFLVVCVCICFPPFLWNVKSVGSAYYFQVHYYGTCFHSGLKFLQKVSLPSVKKVFEFSPHKSADIVGVKIFKKWDIFVRFKTTVIFPSCCVFMCQMRLLLQKLWVLVEWPVELRLC